MTEPTNTADKPTDLRELARSLGIPCNTRGQPDLYKYVPNRRISRDEAKSLGLAMYWPGGGCRYGHDAAVWTSNQYRCVDCERSKHGLPPLYPRLKVGNHYEQPRRKPKDASAPIVMAPQPGKPPEPDPKDREFLMQYAELRDIQEAATACGTTAAQIISRRSHNTILDESMSKLEAELTIPRLVPESSAFEWNDQKRARLIEVYIDSGNLAIARDAIKCTPSQLWRELDSNLTFAGALGDARVRAAQVFEERAHAEALNGNDRLLPIVLKAERPDKYSEKLRLDIHTRYDRMSDEELREKTADLLAQCGLKVVPINATVFLDGKAIDDPSHTIIDAEPAEVLQLASPNAQAD
jgi:hypothetical protein